MRCEEKNAGTLNYMRKKWTLLDSIFLSNAVYLPNKINRRHMNRKKILCVLMLSLLCLCGLAQEKLPPLSDRNLNFILVSDTGMKAEKHRAIASAAAAEMSRIIKENKISFVALAGDSIHDAGVQDVNDPEWKFKVEDIFGGKALHSVPWHAVPRLHRQAP